MQRAWFIVLALFCFGAVGHTAYADDPPPTPTLAPIVGASTSATQTLQLQEFARETAYLVGETTAYTATVNGAVWAIERRFSYGEAGITILLLALTLEIAFLLMYKIVMGERRQ